MAVMLMGLWRRVSESLDGMGRAGKEWGGMVSESYHDGSGLHKLESYSTPLSNPNFQHGISTPLTRCHPNALIVTRKVESQWKAALKQTASKLSQE